ncbi:ectoine synthase [Halomonas sp. I1]|uniref:ectoine synthase n=1 Tax=Halomonas TaxID=2745 RepID=UPI0023B092A5|nr:MULTISPECIES: ectoine synthase [Halomonas]MDT8893703.1 ectoine synthase [Halomonas sp. I1]
MIVRNLEEARQTDRMVTAENGNWDSTRLSLAEDGGNCSFHITRIFEGTETHIHYKHHFEAVYCIEGEGEVETLADGKIWPIKPGDIYILDQHDEHLLRASKTMHLACVFTPGLTGNEVHREDGSYAPADEADDQKPL